MPAELRTERIDSTQVLILSDLASRNSLWSPVIAAGASGKELVPQAAGRSLSAQLDAERDHLVANLFHENAAEGLNAFLEKRSPKFR